MIYVRMHEGNTGISHKCEDSDLLFLSSEEEVTKPATPPSIRLTSATSMFTEEGGYQRLPLYCFLFLARQLRLLAV